MRKAKQEKWAIFRWTESHEHLSVVILISNNENYNFIHITHTLYSQFHWGQRKWRVTCLPRGYYLCKHL